MRMGWAGPGWAGPCSPQEPSRGGVPAQSLQWGRYLVNSVTGTQLLPSGKQKRGMAWRRRSSSSFWPLSRFSRWKEERPRVREREGPCPHQEWGGVQWD